MINGKNSCKMDKNNSCKMNSTCIRVQNCCVVRSIASEFCSRDRICASAPCSRIVCGNESNASVEEKQQTEVQVQVPVPVRTHQQ